MARKNLPKLVICQNCETPTPGNYCPECGQDSREHRVALRLLVVGLWNDLFTFDNRFWRSIVLLLFRPGELTNRFVSGHRVRFVPPARMYLFVSLLFFFAMATLVESEMRDGVAQEEAGLATAAADSSGTIEAPAQDDGRAEARIFGREFDIDEKIFVGAIISLLPKAMFLLLPVFAALLSLVYIRSGRKYVEHLVFSLHLHAFVFILLTVALLSMWFGSWLIAVVLFYVYLYLAMKRVYGQSWGKTYLKHFLLTGAYHTVVFFVILLMLVGSVHLAAWAERYPKWLGWAV